MFSLDVAVLEHSEARLLILSLDASKKFYRIVAASFIKCVEMKIVTLSFRERSIMFCQKASRMIGSTPEVGSSKIRTSGPWIIATANDSL